MEDRLAPAFDVTLSLAATTGVTRTVLAGTATYEATASGANINWVDLGADLQAGLNVVVDSGSAGTEAGDVIDQLGSKSLDSAAGTQLLFRSGSGTGRIGNITLGDTRLRGANSSLVIQAANQVQVGTLDSDLGGPLGSVQISSAQAGIVGGTLVADTVTLSARTGLGTAANALQLRANTLTTDTTSGNGGQFLAEFDSVSVGTGDLRAGSGTITLMGGTFVTGSGGDLLSAVQVQSGSTLAGTGNVGSVVVQNGGTLSPGNGGVGTLISSASVFFQTGSTFLVDIEPTGTSDRLVAASVAVSPNVNLLGTTVPPLSVGTTVTFFQTGSLSVAGVGFRDANGTNLSPTSGGPIVVGVKSYNYQYSTTNLTLTALGSTTVYVEDDWAGTTPGTNPANDPIGGLIFGVNAFADLQTALNNVISGGTVVVFGGDYAGVVTIDKALAPIQVSVNSTLPAQTLVRLTGELRVDTNVSFQTTNANLSLGAVNAVTGDETLTIQGDEVVTLAGLVGATTPLAAMTISADQFTLQANAVISGAVSITTQNGLAFQAGLNAGAGTIRLRANQDGTGTEGFSQSAGTIQTSNDTATAVQIEVGGSGEAALGSIVAGANARVTIQAGGAITDNNGGAVNVTAGTLEALAGAGIELDTAVLAVTARTTGAGNIVLDEVDGITLTNVEAANGSITITANGAMLASRVVILTDSDSNDITLTAQVGDLTVGTITAGSGAAGDVLLTATTGNVLDDGTNATTITGDVVTLTAFRALGQPGAVEQLDTTARSLVATTTGAGPFTGVPTAGIWVSDSDALAVTNATTGNGVVVISANGNLDVQSVTTGGATGSVRLTSGGTLTVSQNVTSTGLNANQTLIADDMDILVAGALQGNAELFLEPRTPGRGISLGATSEQSGRLSLTVRDLQGIGSSFTRVTIGREDGTGRITVEGNATFGTEVVLRTPGVGSGGIGASGTLDVGAHLLTLRSGSTITTSGAGLYKAEDLLLLAVTGIGTAANPVNTQVSKLEAETSTGGIFIENTGALILGGVSGAVDGVEVFTSGDIEIRATSSLTVIEDVTNAIEDITLIAEDSPQTGDDLTVGANVEIKTNGGNIVLQAGDNLTIATTALLQTFGVGTIVLVVDAVDADPGQGGTMTVSGDSLDAPGGAVLQGNTDADTFTISPSPSTPIQINGNLPGSNPGDVLNLNLDGFSAQTLQVTERYTGTMLFSDAGKITINAIEKVNLTNGSVDVVLDLSQASLNGTPFGNGNAGLDQVRASLSGNGVDLILEVAQDGGALTEYFVVTRAGTDSLLGIGSSDRTRFTLQETAGGMPRFAGEVPATFQGVPTGAHSNAANLPPNTFDVTNVSIHLKGTSRDELALELIATHQVQYFADLVQPQSGNLSVAQAVLLSFEGMEGLTFTGAGGTLLADATLVTATTMQVGAGTAGDGFSEITGNGGFTTARFRGFPQVTVRGGTGSQTMTLEGLDALDAALTGLTLSGDNAFGNDPAADTIEIQALRAGVTATLIGGAGNDAFLVVPGVINVQGGTGANRLVVDASIGGTNRTITLSRDRIQGGTGFDVSYTAVGGSYAGVELETGDGTDAITVQSTAGATEIRTGGGNDAIVVGTGGALSSLLSGLLMIDAGAGVNSLQVGEATSGVANTVTVQADALIGVGFRVGYRATGGSFGLLSFTAGQGADTLRVTGRGATRVQINGGGGNDRITVLVSPTNLPTGIEVDGGGGTNSLNTTATGPGAVIRDIRTGPGQGMIQVSFGANRVGTYSYRNIARVGDVDANSNYVQALFQHIMGRSATRAELNRWVGVLQSQGRLAVVRGLEYTPEARWFLVRKWFQLFKGRTPTRGEALPFVQRLLAGQSEETVLGRLLRNLALPRTGAIRARLVNYYYQDLLRRNPTAAELAMWVNGPYTLATIRILIEVGDEFFREGV